jgi:hypothetical protein
MEAYKDQSLVKGFIANTEWHFQPKVATNRTMDMVMLSQRTPTAFIFDWGDRSLLIGKPIHGLIGKGINTFFVLYNHECEQWIFGSKIDVDLN